MSDQITIALPTGRILKEASSLFVKAGIDISAVLADDRRLSFSIPGTGISAILTKPSDVPVYVDKGAADLGVAGLDTVIEHGFDLLTPLDLRIGRCRMCVASPIGGIRKSTSKLRVATKFPAITRAHFAKTSRQIEMIKLYGSIELAPLTGIADCIVDIVSTGETLKKNGLEVIEEIMPISSILVANRISFKNKVERIRQIIEEISKSVGEENNL